MYMQSYKALSKKKRLPSSLFSVSNIRTWPCKPCISRPKTCSLPRDRRPWRRACTHRAAASPPCTRSRAFMLSASCSHSGSRYWSRAHLGLGLSVGGGRWCWCRGGSYCIGQLFLMLFFAPRVSVHIRKGRTYTLERLLWRPCLARIVMSPLSILRLW